MTLHDCPACELGDHDKHVEIWMPAPPGGLGGAHCDCTGDCKRRAAGRLDNLLGFPRVRSTAEESHRSDEADS